MYKVKAKRILALFLSMGLLVVSLAACGNEVDATLADEELIVPTEANYKTVQAEIGTFTDEAYSTVKAFYPVEKDLFYNEPDVVFSKLLVKKGDVVKKGQHLAAFKATVSEVPLEEKKLELKRTRNAYDRGKENRRAGLSDARKVLGQLSSGTTEYRIKQLEIEKSEIEYDQFVFSNDEKIKTLEKEIAKLSEAQDTQYLEAPFSGTIGIVGSFREGDKMDPTVPVLVLYSAERILLQLDNPNGFSYGEEVEINAKVGGKDESMKAKVVCSPTALPSSLIAAPTYVMLETKGINIEKVSNVTVKSTSVFMPNVLTVDAEAVKMVNGQFYVSILEDNTLKKRYLTSVNFNKTDFWVLDGLSEGQTVVKD